MRAFRWTCATAALMVAVLVVLATPASAHVTIDPEAATQGSGDLVITFRVPNEEATANTTSIDIQFPTDHPIAQVDPEAVPGWTSTVTMTHLATPITTDDGTVTDVVSEIQWTGGTIPPGQYGEFKVLAQGLPDGVDSLKFPAVQTYSDGSTVSWIQDTPPGGPEPDHPAPLLTLTPSPDSSSATNSSGSSSSQTAAGPTVQSVVKKETNSGLAIAALAVGILAAILASVALTRRRTT